MGQAREGESGAQLVNGDLGGDLRRTGGGLVGPSGAGGVVARHQVVGIFL